MAQLKFYGTAYVLIVKLKFYGTAYVLIVKLKFYGTAYVLWHSLCSMAKIMLELYCRARVEA